jgi:hypothetical protein
MRGKCIMSQSLLKATLISLVFPVAFLAAPTAFAYSVGPGSSGNAPGSAACGQAITFSGTFVQPDGTPFPAGVPVGFSESSGPAAVSFNPSGTATNSAGAFATTITLPSNCAGQFVICATPSGGTSLCVTITGVAVGFPNTAAGLLPQGSRDLLPVAVGSALLLVAAALAIVVGIRVTAARKANEKPAV